MGCSQYNVCTSYIIPILEIPTSSRFFYLVPFSLKYSEKAKNDFLHTVFFYGEKNIQLHMHMGYGCHYKISHWSCAINSKFRISVWVRRNREQNLQHSIVPTPRYNDISSLWWYNKKRWSLTITQTYIQWNQNATFLRFNKIGIL